MSELHSFLQLQIANPAIQQDSLNRTIKFIQHWKKYNSFTSMHTLFGAACVAILWQIWYICIIMRHTQCRFITSNNYNIYRLIFQSDIEKKEEGHKSNIAVLRTLHNLRNFSHIAVLGNCCIKLRRKAWWHVYMLIQVFCISLRKFWSFWTEKNILYFYFYLRLILFTFAMAISASEHLWQHWCGRVIHLLWSAGSLSLAVILYVNSR